MLKVRGGDRRIGVGEKDIIRPVPPIGRFYRSTRSLSAEFSDPSFRALGQLGMIFVFPDGLRIVENLKQATPVHGFADDLGQKGARDITADMSLRLGLFFGQSGAFWHNLQKDYELRKATRERLASLKKTVRPLESLKV